MNVTLIIGTTPLALAVDQVLGDWVVNVSVLSGEVSSLYQRVDSATPTIVLNDVPPGSYTATAQRFDTGGNAFGQQVSASFEVPAPVVAPVEPPADPTPPVDPSAPPADSTPVVAMGDAAADLTVTLS